MTDTNLRRAPFKASGLQCQYLRALARRAVETWRVPGLALAVTLGDDVIVAEGFGHTGKGTAVNDATLFALASCTKPMAAATIARLVRESHCDWQTPVHEVLPWFTFPDARHREQVTVEDLLVHRLGISSSEHRHRPFMRTRRELLERLHLQSMRHPFLQGFGYCTDAYTVAGELVCAIAGEPWEAYARQSIWLPLGMMRTNASCELSREEQNSAAPHAGRGSRLRPVAWAYEDWAATPAGGVNSTAADMAQWLLAWTATTPRLAWLDNAAASWMLEPITAIGGAYDEAEFTSFLARGPDGIESPACSRGWYVHRYRGERIAYHCGGIHGFRAITGLIPDRRLGVAVMVNAEMNPLPRALFQTLVDHVLEAPETDWIRKLQCESEGSAPEADPIRRAAAAVQEAETFIGSYHDDGLLGSARIALSHGLLKLVIRDCVFVLYPSGALTFVSHQVAGRARVGAFELRFRAAAAAGASGFETDTGLSFIRSAA